MDREEFQKAYGKVVAKAWEDHESEKKMKKVVGGFRVKVGIKCGQTRIIPHVILHARQLSEEELEKVAGGEIRPEDDMQPLKVPEGTGLHH